MAPVSPTPPKPAKQQSPCWSRIVPLKNDSTLCVVVRSPLIRTPPPEHGVSEASPRSRLLQAHASSLKFPTTPSLLVSSVSSWKCKRRFMMRASHMSARMLATGLSFIARFSNARPCARDSESQLAVRHPGDSAQMGGGYRDGFPFGQNSGVQ